MASNRVCVLGDASRARVSQAEEQREKVGVGAEQLLELGRAAGEVADARQGQQLRLLALLGLVGVERRPDLQQHCMATAVDQAAREAGLLREHGEDADDNYHSAVCACVTLGASEAHERWDELCVE